jgi:hypothetical protein
MVVSFECFAAAQKMAVEMEIPVDQPSAMGKKPDGI